MTLSRNERTAAQMDAERRARSARVFDIILATVGIGVVAGLAAWCAGLIGTRGNVFDAAPMGEARRMEAGR